MNFFGTPERALITRLFRKKSQKEKFSAENKNVEKWKLESFIINMAS